MSKESIVVAYDWIRGEPRGKIKKQATEPDQSKGDCIDCKLCVHACPTGIDIRNGTQLECVNCTACIDACDDVMTKINRPTGLIRYDSHEGIATGKKFKFTPRVMGYTVVLALLASAFVFLLASREDIETTVLRVPGTLFQEQPNNRVSNLYNIQFVNKTFEEITLEVKLLDSEQGAIKKVGQKGLIIPPNEKIDGTFFVELPRSELKGRSTSIKLGIYENGKLMESIKSNFLGPFTQE